MNKPDPDQIKAFERLAFENSGLPQSAFDGWMARAELLPSQPAARLNIQYCAASPVSNVYSAGATQVSEVDLVVWIFEQLRSGKPLLITEMDEM